MKIIAYEASRLTILFPYEEVVPLAGVNDREIIEKVTARYKFLKSPSLVSEEITKNGYRFRSWANYYKRLNRAHRRLYNLSRWDRYKFRKNR